MLRQGSFAAGAQAVGAALAGIFDDMAEGVIVAESLEQEVPQRAERWIGKGSLAKVYKPCIRKNCPACQRGDKHPAWLLSLSSRGRRKTMYVPQAMVSTLRKAIRNGRRIERLLYRTGPKLLREYRKIVRKL